MKTDNNPSILAINYGEIDKIMLFAQRLKEMGAGVRILLPIDIAVPLEKKDEILNYIKHFVWCDYLKDKNPIQLMDKIPSMFRPKTLMGYKFYDLSKIDEWLCDSSHELTGLQFFPIAYQDHTYLCTTPQEVEAIRDISIFRTKDFEPILNYKNDTDFIKAEDYNGEKI